jgi:hypothetical protein
MSVGRPQGVQEQTVQPDQPLAVVQIVGGKPVAQNQRVSLHDNIRVPCWWRHFGGVTVYGPHPAPGQPLFVAGAWQPGGPRECGRLLVYL